MVKARVFISCGQSTEKEKEIGGCILKYLQEKGFEPYFAEEVHSPLGLTQSVFNSIKQSEYFVCINFQRKHTKTGSLFVQQELAIAAFLELPLIAFHEPKVELEGVAKYLHVNSIPFNKKSDIIKKLNKTIKDWDPNSKNQFGLSFGREDLNVTIFNQNNHLSNWYHFTVNNLSSTLNAKNCYSYIDKIDNLESNMNIFDRNQYKNELIWSGTGVTNVDIPIQSKRDIDAIFTVQGTNQWLFQERNTSTVYKYPNLSNGKYRITYVVHSDNFPSTTYEIEIKLINDKLTLLNEKQF